MRFEPRVNTTSVHHMLLFGCHVPFATNQTWYVLCICERHVHTTGIVQSIWAYQLCCLPRNNNGILSNFPWRYTILSIKFLENRFKVYYCSVFVIQKWKNNYNIAVTRSCLNFLENILWSNTLIDYLFGNEKESTTCCCDQKFYR